MKVDLSLTHANHQIVANSKVNRLLRSFAMLMALWVCNAGWAVSVTISQGSLSLDPRQPHGEVRLLSGAEALEYEITLVEQPDDAGTMLWSPRRLTVPPNSSTPVRFSYRANGSDNSEDMTFVFLIRVKQAQNTGPLESVPREQDESSSATGVQSEVRLEPALRFRVHVGRSG